MQSVHCGTGRDRTEVRTVVQYVGTRCTSYTQRVGSPVDNMKDIFRRRGHLQATISRVGHDTLPRLLVDSLAKYI